MIIKLVLIVGMVLACVLAYRTGRGARSLALRRIGLLAVVGMGVLAVLVPQLTGDLAQMVGVGRGADLLLYLFVIGSLFVWIGLYRRLHDMEERFTDLTRSIALEQDRRRHEAGSSVSSSSHRSG